MDLRSIRTPVALALILGVALILCVLVLAQHSRFVTQNAGDGRIYRIDRLTGHTVLVVGDQEIPVSRPTKPEESIPESDHDRAIRLAKADREALGGTYLSTDEELTEIVKDLKGPLRILGWRAKEVDSQTWVVAYCFEHESRVRAAAFEVNLVGGFVRSISERNDPELHSKYHDLLEELKKE